MKAVVLFCFICFALPQILALTQICLRSGQTTLSPVRLNNPKNCPNNYPKGCMSEVYKYGNFKYNGVASLIPNLGEIFMFLTQDNNDDIDFVMIMNPTIETRVDTEISLQGVAPVEALIVDDPTEGTWNSTHNNGSFAFGVKPTFTDGLVIGHLRFISNYCVKAKYVPIHAEGIKNVSIISGAIGNITRITTTPFSSSLTFEFCQYPVTASSHHDVTCRGASTGRANITVISAPEPIVYDWKNSAGVTVSTTNSVQNVPAGTYTVTVNAGGCTSNREIIITEPAAMSGEVTSQDPTLSVAGWARITITGGTPPYSYTWKNDKGVVVSTSAEVSSVQGGTYTIDVNDNCGGIYSSSVTLQKLRACPAGTYISVAADACVVCPPGSFTNETEQTACIECAANEYSSGGNNPCSPCPVSTHSSAKSGSCMPCPPGTHRTASSSMCTSCPAGTHRCRGNILCQSCQVGSYSLAGASYCESCQPGFYQFHTGASSCRECPVNTYSGSKARSCTACPSGLTAIAGSTDDVACGFMA